MKYKWMKKAVSILVAAAVCLSPAAAVGTQTVFAQDTRQAVKEVMYVSNALELLTMVTEKPMLTYDLSANEAQIQPLKMKKAGFFSYDVTTQGKKVTVKLYKDAACTKEVKQVNENQTTGALVKAGTYYLKTESSTACKVEISMCEVPSSPPSSMKIVDSDESDDEYDTPIYYLAKGKTAYIKIRMPSLGALEIMTQSETPAIICDTNKKPLEKVGEEVEEHYLSKGSYYIKLIGSGQLDLLMIDMYGAKEAKNNTRSKAATLHAGSDTGSIIAIGKQNREHWYKFTLKSDCKNDLYISTEESNGLLGYEIYRDSVGIASGRISDYDGFYLKYTNAKTKLWKKGTYYIRIYGKNKSSSGEFYIGRGNYLQNLKFGKISDQAYTGKMILPSVTVKDGKKKLSKGKDYTLSYSNNQKIGTATVKIKAVKYGSYDGSKTLKFKIVPNAVKIKEVSRKNGTLNVKWAKNDQADRYQIAYADNKSMKKAKTVTVKGKSSVSKTIKNVTSGKNCYVRVRACKKVSGKMYNGKWSKIKKA